jgi:betaine reductase
MVKGIEKVGIPAVHICSIVNISQVVGANRILPAIAIPHPTGNPSLEASAEFALRKKLMEKALSALSANIQEQTMF